MIADQKTVKISFVLLSFRSLWVTIKIKTHIPDEPIFFFHLSACVIGMFLEIRVTFQSQCQIYSMINSLTIKISPLSYSVHRPYYIQDRF